MRSTILRRTAAIGTLAALPLAAACASIRQATTQQSKDGFGLDRRVW